MRWVRDRVTVRARVNSVCVCMVVIQKQAVTLSVMKTLDAVSRALG